jgi:hypothetical protein
MGVRVRQQVRLSGRDIAASYIMPDLIGRVKDIGASNNSFNIMVFSLAF